MASHSQLLRGTLSCYGYESKTNTILSSSRMHQRSLEEILRSMFCSLQAKRLKISRPSKKHFQPQLRNSKDKFSLCLLTLILKTTAVSQNSSELILRKSQLSAWSTWQKMTWQNTRPKPLKLPLRMSRLLSPQFLMDHSR